MTIRFDRTGLTESSVPALEFADAALRGVGQVTLQDNSFTGLLFLVGIYVGSPSSCLAALVGALTSTATAYLLGLDRALVRAGLYGFNGTLVAIALAFFLRPDPVMWLYVVSAAATSTVATAGLANLLGRNRPGLTAPFILVTWVFVIAVDRFGALHATGMLPTAELPKGATEVVGIVSASTVSEGVLKGIAEIFLQDDTVTGAIFLAGLLVGSRVAGVAAALGALVGVLVAWGLGAPEPAIRLGLFSFNPALTAVALASVFLVLDVRSALYSLLAVVVTAVLFSSVSAALRPIGMPALTAPFVLVTWAFLFAAPASRRLSLR